MGLLYAGVRKPLSGEIDVSGWFSSSKSYLSLELYVWTVRVIKPKSLEIGSFTKKGQIFV